MVLYPLVTGSALRSNRQLLWLLLTSAMGPGRLSTLSVTQDNMADLPGYCALTLTLMPVGSTSRRSVQVLGFASIRLLTPPCRLYPLPVRQASALPTASSRFRLAADTLAVQLTLPFAWCVEDFHLQVSAPCRAHPEQKGCSKEQPFCSLSTIHWQLSFTPVRANLRDTLGRHGFRA
jgi:hypothetical protein